MRRKKNGNTKIVVLIILLLVVVFGIYFYNRNQAKAPAVESQSATTTSPQSSETPSAATTPSNTKPQTQTQVKGSNGPDYSPGTFSSGEGEMLGSDVSVFEVQFDGTKFLPTAKNVKVGDYIFFKNSGTASFTLISKDLGVKEVVGLGGTYKQEFTKTGNFLFTNDSATPATVYIDVSK